MRFFAFFALLFWVSSNSMADDWVTFIDQKKRIGPKLEWNREIVASKPGVVRCQIESGAPFNVALVAERTYRAMLRRDVSQSKREDVLITTDSRRLLFEQQFSVPTAGSFWFILQNQCSNEVEMHLSCAAPRKS
jgi:hypothetical protein